MAKNGKPTSAAPAPGAEVPALLSERFVVMRPDELGPRMALLKENLGSARMDVFDLPRYKVPTGGQTLWEVPALDGTEPEFEKHLEGVILVFRDGRRYYRTSIDEGGAGHTPPDCISDDLVRGVGDPGGFCQACPYSQFGSRRGASGAGRGQACREQRVLFVLRLDDVLPVMVTVPPTSLKNARGFFSGLALTHAVPYWGVITRISLVRDKSAAGIDYAKMTFAVSEKLDATGAARIRAFRAEIEPVLVRVRSDEAVADSGPIKEGAARGPEPDGAEDVPF